MGVTECPEWNAVDVRDPKHRRFTSVVDGKSFVAAVAPVPLLSVAAAFFNGCGALALGAVRVAFFLA